MSGFSNPAGVGLNLGVGIAVLVFIGACALLAAMFILSPSMRYVERQHAQEGAGRQLEIGASGIKVSVSKSGPAGGTGEPAVETSTAPAAPAVQSDALAEGSRAIVVLRDPVAYQEPQRTEIDRALARLTGAGFALIGGTGGSSTTIDDETVADLRNAIGVAPFETRQSEEAIRAWLATRDDVLMALWIGRHEGGQPTVWLVGRTGLDTGTEAAATGARAGGGAARPAAAQGATSGRSRGSR
jgi:hypothetical protein